MKYFFRFLVIFAFVLLSVQNALSQKVLSAKDYNDADSIADLFNKKVFHTVQKVNWVERKPVFWYSTFTAKGKEFWTVNAEKLSKEKLFETDKLARQLSDMIKKPVKKIFQF